MNAKLETILAAIGDKPDPIPKDLVAHYRVKLGLSRHALAALIGCSYNSVLSWETGQRRCSKAEAKLLYLLVYLNEMDLEDAPFEDFPQI